MSDMLDIFLFGLTSLFNPSDYDEPIDWDEYHKYIDKERNKAYIKFQIKDIRKEMRRGTIDRKYGNAAIARIKQEG